MRATTLPVSGRVDVADRLGRLELADGGAGLDLVADLGQRDVDDVAQGVLGVVGDADPDRRRRSRPGCAPTRARRCTSGPRETPGRSSVVGGSSATCRLSLRAGYWVDCGSAYCGVPVDDTHAGDLDVVGLLDADPAAGVAHLVGEAAGEVQRGRPACPGRRSRRWRTAAPAARRRRPPRPPGASSKRGLRDDAHRVVDLDRLGAGVAQLLEAVEQLVEADARRAGSLTVIRMPGPGRRDGAGEDAERRRPARGPARGRSTAVSVSSRSESRVSSRLGDLLLGPPRGRREVVEQLDQLAPGAAPT